MWHFATGKCVKDYVQDPIGRWCELVEYLTNQDCSRVEICEKYECECVVSCKTQYNCAQNAYWDLGNQCLMQLHEIYVADLTVGYRPTDYNAARPCPHSPMYK